MGFHVFETCHVRLFELHAFCVIHQIQTEFYEGNVEYQGKDQADCDVQIFPRLDALPSSGFVIFLHFEDNLSNSL